MFAFSNADAASLHALVALCVRRNTQALMKRWDGTSQVDKLLFGVLWFAVIMLVLVLPMMMFSSLNPGLAENRVTACTAQVWMMCLLRWATHHACLSPIIFTTHANTDDVRGESGRRAVQHKSGTCEQQPARNQWVGVHRSRVTHTARLCAACRPHSPGGTRHQTLLGSIAGGSVEYKCKLRVD